MQVKLALLHAPPLCFLSSAGLVKATTGDRLGRVVQAAASLVTGVGVAFSASWRLSLISMGVMPLVAGVQVLQVRYSHYIEAVSEMLSL